jgi:chaperonin GroEL
VPWKLRFVKSLTTPVSTVALWLTKFRKKPLNMGYDANKGQYVDMIKSGIIDPVKVVRTALTNAASISGLLLTTEALVTTYDKDDKKKRKVEGSVN